MKQWQTARIVQLEQQLEEYIKLNTMQARCAAPCRAESRPMR
jgi:hypothetical protein